MRVDRDVNNVISKEATSDANPVLTYILNHKRYILIFVLVFLGLATVYIRTAHYLYRAELRVTPVEAERNAQSSMGGLAAVAGISLGGSKGTPFSLYTDGFDAPPVAATLALRTDLTKVVFDSEWNSRQQRFEEPHSAVRTLSNSIKHALGIPVYKWRAPDAVRMQAYLKDNIRVVQTLKSPVVTLQYEHEDPQFAVQFLTAVNAVLDDTIRQKARTRSEQNIAYLSDQLRHVTLAEHRAAIAQSLSEEVKTRMLASSSMAYAAEPFGGATASFRPVQPKPAIVLMLSLVVGLMAGVLFVIARYQFALVRRR